MTTEAALERILEPAFLDDVGAWPNVRVREVRSLCESHEEALSYARRLVHGRLDVLHAELQRRSADGDAHAADALADLPTILSTREGGPTDVAQVRAMRLRVPEKATAYVASIDEWSVEDPRARAVDELRDAIEALDAYERELSTVRRALFDRIDTLRDELAARYKDGQASVRDVLGARLD